MNRIKAYLSHPIRGPEGNNAGDETMAKNNLVAQSIGNLISSIYPNMDLYVPADMDDFLIERGRKPLHYVNELLELDYRLVAESDLLLVYSPDGYVGGGMAAEVKVAEQNGIPIVYFGQAGDKLCDEIEEVMYH